MAPPGEPLTSVPPSLIHKMGRRVPAYEGCLEMICEGTVPRAWHIISVFTEFSPGAIAHPRYLGRWPLARHPGRSRRWERCRCHARSQRSRGLGGERQVREQRQGEGALSVPAQGVSARWGGCLGLGDRHLRRVQCPLPMEGAQPGQQPLPNPERQTWGPSRRLQERREHIPCSDTSTEE